MPKTIPIALADTLAAGVSTVSFLCKIGPLKDDSYLTWTSIDKDEKYDDGDGERTYVASTGVQLTTFESTNDLSVDNGEAQSLGPIYPNANGITTDMVLRGLLDDAEFVIYQHDVFGAAGEHSEVASGILGRVRMQNNGVVAIPELRAWTQLLEQTGVISETCLDCRSKRFGSQIGEEREPCEYDIDGNDEWKDFTVTDVGTEDVREFYTADLPDGDYPSDSEGGYFAPGLVEWQTGDNAGQSREVESFSGSDSSSDAYVSLRFTTRKPVQIGDTGRIRRDCTRKWDGHNSCNTYWGALKGKHFNGEPFINIGDTGANSVPGVNSTVSTGGTGESTGAIE